MTINQELLERKQNLQEMREKRQQKLISEQDQEQNKKEEILAARPNRVLAVCYAGKYRSKMTKKVLEEKGYEAQNIGVNYGKEEDLDIKEFDAVIFTTSKVKQKFLEMYEYNGPTRVIGLSEDNAFHGASDEVVQGKRDEISTMLDDLGFIDVDEFENVQPSDELLVQPV